MNKKVIYLIGAIVGVAAVTLLMTQNSPTPVATTSPAASPSNGLLATTPALSTAVATATAAATDAALSAAGVIATPTAVAPVVTPPAGEPNTGTDATPAAPTMPFAPEAVPAAPGEDSIDGNPSMVPDTTDMPEDSSMPATDPSFAPAGSSDDVPAGAEVAPQPTTPDAVTNPIPGAIDEKPITPSEGQ